MIGTIRQLLAEKTQLIKRIHYRQTNEGTPLTETERTEYRNEMRRNRVHLLELIRKQAEKVKDPEHILEEEFQTIVSLT